MLQPTRILSCVFFFSGFCALIYQVTWQRLLTVYYGVGSVSTTLIVSVYMAGLGFGALIGGSLVERSKNKISLFSTTQLLIGSFGLLSLPLLDFLGKLTAGSNYVLTFFYMALFLMLPTLLMGMTFPILTKIFNNLVKDFRRTVGFLYFINSIGAACGAVFGSYVLISFLGLDSAIYIASVINILLAWTIYRLGQTPFQRSAVKEAPREHKEALGRIAYLVVFITGFVGMGYEMIWIRVVGILIKDSPYTFPSILFVVLLGISLGSYYVSQRLTRQKFADSKNIYFMLQFLIGVSVFLTFVGYYYLTQTTSFSKFTLLSASFEPHPSPLAWQIIGFAKSKMEVLKGIYSLIDVFFWPMVFIFVPSLLMGASFPLVAKLAMMDVKKEGETIGNVYFFSILGNVVGVVATGFFLLSNLGTEMTALLFISINIFFGFFVSSIAGRPIRMVYKMGVVGGLVLLAVMIFPRNGKFYQTMHMLVEQEDAEFLYEEGVSGVVVTVHHRDFLRNFINGVEHGGRPGAAFYVQAIDALSFVPEAKDVLVIGYGTGSTVEAVLKHHTVKNITVVEVSKALIKNLGKIDLFKTMLEDKRVKLVYDDGRRFLLRSKKKYDLVLIDPLKTTAAYSNNVFSKQFFDLVSQNLKPNGVFMVWTDEFGVVTHTLAQAFPFVHLYAWKQSAYGIASNAPLKRSLVTVKRLTSRFPERDRTAIINTTPKFMGTREDMIRLLAKYPINQDWKPISEYYIGLRTLRKWFYLK